MQKLIFASSAYRRNIRYAESPSVTDHFWQVESTFEPDINAGDPGARRSVVDDEARREQHEQAIRPYDYDG